MLICGSVVGASEPQPGEVEFFEQRIRPVLIQHCYECHNSAETSEAELALDHRDALMRGGESGSVISEPSIDSLLLKVIRHEIDGVEMPEGGPKLSDEVIADFEKWLAMGAPDPRDNPPSAEELAGSTSWEAIREKRKQWWSFQPIKRPTVPDVDGISHPIDRLVRAKMNEAGLNPAPRANRESLARRLSYSLIGLPPTPEEVSQFVNDPAADAYERYVDRLLKSPRFGERWARHWMDWIRYAESHGSEGDPIIVGASHYRDHLIRSLNADVPYDQMVREHIAGDLLESPRINEDLGINESQVATAHWRMVFHGFAPTDALDEKVRFIDDAVNVFSKAFLGLTVSCARCHNHKFDAISQADYYALFGIIGSARPGRAAIDAPERLQLYREALAGLKTEIRSAIASDWIKSLPQVRDRLVTTTLEAKNEKQVDSLTSLFSKMKNANDFTAAWSKLLAEASDQEASDQSDKSNALQRWNLAKPEDHREWFAYGTGTIEQTSLAGAYSLEHTGDQVVRGIYPAGVYSHLISDKHGAVFTSPQVHLAGQYDLWLHLSGGGNSISRYVVQDYPRNGTVYPVTELKGPQDSSWHWQKYDMTYWDGDDVHLELATANDSAVLVKNQERSWFGIREAVIVPKDTPLPDKSDREWMQPLLEKTKSTVPGSFDEFVELVSKVIEDSVRAWRRGEMSDSQALLLDQCIREGILPNSMDALTQALPLVERYRELESKIPVARRAPALAEWAGSDHPLYERGDHKQPREWIPRRFLEAIDETPYESTFSGRLQLAEDVLRQDNPFTARVIVNRIWHHLFGRGIVGTNDNFGRLGQVPTHPELLDYLADEFRHTDGWSIKSMIRRVVTSQTWQQDSVPSEAARRSDPNNEFYSHYSVQRLEAEAIRDAMLAISGKLDDAMFGDPVPGNSNRRSVYVQVIRNALDPFLATFDAPVPFSCMGRRDVTNVPAQALLMMNDPFVVQSAKRFADRALAENSLVDDRMRIVWMWQQALGRRPTEDEIQFAASYLSDAADRMKEWSDASEKLSTEARQVEIAMSQLNETAMQRIVDKEVKIENRVNLRPLAEWLFDEGEVDSMGDLNLQLRGTAKVIDGALVLDGDGWAESEPFPFELKEKTLEAIVQLDDLQQRGGGVMTIQDTRGSIFDSIVFAERTAKQWLAGSNNHRRTQPFAGSDEADAASRSVHLVITYDASGIVTGYRDGLQYGESYKTELQPFSAGDGQVVFGMRHGKSASGNRMLRGRVLEARLYSHALTSDEVAAVASGQSDFVSKLKRIAALTDEERRQWDELQSRSELLHEKLDDSKSKVDPNQPWVDLAHSIFNMKEFIYVR